MVTSSNPQVVDGIAAPGGSAPAQALAERACEVCGSTKVRPLPQYTVSPWPVVACADCGFVFLHTVPGNQALVETYAWEKTFAAEKERRRRRSWNRFDEITRWRLHLGKRQDQVSRAAALGGSGNVLDIGCGGGSRLPASVTPYGIEISSVLAAAADEKFRARGGFVVAAPASEGLDRFEDGFFSSILMRSYLEHEERPREVLAKAFAKLKPGGRIYVRVPNFGSINRRVMGTRWCGFRFPDHVNYFTEKSLKALATSVGLTYQRRNRASLFDDNLIVELARPTSAG